MALFDSSREERRSLSRKRLVACSRIACVVRQEMTEKGVLDAERPAEFVVSFDRAPDGVGAVDFRRLS